MVQPAKSRFNTRTATAAMQEPVEAIQGALRSAQETIEEYPATAVITAFAVGLSVGVGVGMLLSCQAQPPSNTWSRMW